MNAATSPLRRRLAAALALFLTALCATRADFADADRLVPIPGDTRVARGMHRDDVVLRLGRPDDTVATSLWVYWNFHARGRLAGDGLDTLVVFFAKDRVSWLRLTEREATIALLHKLRLPRVPDATPVATASDVKSLRPKSSTR